MIKAFFRQVSFPVGSVPSPDKKDPSKVYLNARGIPAESDDFIQFGCKEPLAAGVYDVVANIRSYDKFTFFDLLQAQPVKA